jgi:hypothetical protein
MTETSRNWQRLRDANTEVPAKPARAIWTAVLDYLTGPLTLRITATGTWQPVEGLPACGPDGFAHWVFGRDLLINKKAPLGSLIAKIGGSAAGVDDGVELFLLGSYAVLTIDKASGPLYLTINDAPSGFDDNVGEVRVIIEQAL